MGNLLHNGAGKRKHQENVYAYDSGTGQKGTVYAGIRRKRISREGLRTLYGFPESERRRASDQLRRYGAEQLITTMLTPAEFEDFSTKVLQVNGFQTGDELVAEAKN